MTWNFQIFHSISGSNHSKFYLQYADTIKLHLIQKENLKVINIPAVLQDKFC